MGFHRASRVHWARAFVAVLRPSAQPLSKQRVSHLTGECASEYCTALEWRLGEYWRRSWDCSWDHEYKPTVPERGVEPLRPQGQRILSAPRLPFRHSGRLAYYAIVAPRCRFVVHEDRLGGCSRREDLLVGGMCMCGETSQPLRLNRVVNVRHARNHRE